LVNVSTTVHNGANYPKQAGLFDRVLVDAPCSCEGTTRKGGTETRMVDPTFALKKSGLQRALLRRAVQLCKPGGRIVYATCTYAPEENEAVVDAILTEFGSETVRLLPVAVVEFQSAPGLTGCDDRTFDPSLRLALRAWPHQNDTGGFFVAVPQKSGPQQPANKETAALFSPSPAMPTGGPARMTAQVLNRFGIPLPGDGDFVLFRPGRRGICLVNAGHRPPELPKPDSAGMLFIKSRHRYPKLSTAATMLLGQQATRNVINLGEPQFWA
jgi:16S rRNA (cytosine1407-C5)-methyltransferase